MVMGPEILKKGGKPPPNRPPAPSAKLSAPSVTEAPAPSGADAFLERSQKSLLADLVESDPGQVTRLLRREGDIFLVQWAQRDRDIGGVVSETEDSSSQADSVEE